MRRLGSTIVGILLIFLGSDAPGFEVDRVATGLSRPVFATAPSGDTGRIFIVEQHSGNIRILRLSDLTLLSPAFLTIPGLSTGNEQGLLGLAFDPEYAINRFFYVYVTVPDTQILRYQASADDPNLADATTARLVLGFSQPQSNHNGGWIGFGPNDGLLYIATGDGGSGDDSGSGHTDGIGNAQDLTSNLLGKILRIDVSADDFPADTLRNYAIPADNPFVDTVGDDEIWAYGLRNPYRASFDRETGDFFIGDVGQTACEEIDVQPADSSGGESYGWRLREGTIATPTGGIGGAAPGAIDPVFDYPHRSTQSCTTSGADGIFLGVSAIGGYVYRGPVEELVGRYFFADHLTARLWSFIWDGSTPSSFDGTNYLDLTDHGDDPAFAPDVGTIASLSSFGEDAQGNLYILDLNGGEVFRLPEPSADAASLAALLSLSLLARGRVRFTRSWRRFRRARV